MTREEAALKAKELVSKMTLAEKASQIKYDSPAIERLDVPAYNWWSEALHGVARAGVATVFPQAIGMAAIFDDEFLEKVATAVSTEGRAKYNAYSAEEDRDIYKGLTMWSPNVNIFRDPRWGRGHETYGEDPYLTGELGKAYVNGLQGKGEHIKIAACAKHFAVHSGPEALRHSFDAVSSKKDLYETYLPAFEKLVKEANVESVMGAYNRTNGEVCCGHSYLMQEVLRGKWGFKGHFVSDCWAVRDFHENHKVTKTPTESVALALKSGCDVNCGCTYAFVLDAYNEGLITEEDIDTACIRLFTTRYLLGMFEPCEYDSLGLDVVECKEHRELAVEAARKSAVLLKNDGTLPLKKEEIKSVAVIGPNADSRRVLAGNYHGTSSRYITVLEGIQKELDDTARVYFSEGSHLFMDKVEGLAFEDDRISEAVSIAKISDVTVLVLGLDETLEGEEGDTGNSYASGDKKDLLLPPAQMRLLEVMINLGKPVILLNMTGSSIDLSMAISNDNVKAILQTWYPGAEGGTAIADILFGKVSPSGKLPVTFYESADELPEFTDYSMKNRTYRYFTGVPQYPFGYGLTYGKVEIGNILMPNIDVLLNKNAEDIYNGKLTVGVQIKNVSSVDTEEVIQLYIKDNKSEYAVTNHSLCGFKRVFLAAGEEKTVNVSVPTRAFMAVNNEGEYILDSNDFTLYAGVSQPDKKSITLCGVEPAIIPIRL